MLKAIETSYNGYRFRSRLEARWAVFFDTLEIPWEYEKEGYDLDGAGWYLPDFWLPSINAWFEVKPYQNQIENRGKVRALADAHRPVILAEGNIGEETLTIFAQDLTDSSGGAYEYEGFFYMPYRFKILYFAVYDSRVERDRIVFADWEDITPLKWVTYLGEGVYLTPRVETAYKTARQARFEHGETPKVSRGKFRTK